MRILVIYLKYRILVCTIPSILHSNIPSITGVKGNKKCTLYLLWTIFPIRRGALHTLKYSTSLQNSYFWISRLFRPLTTARALTKWPGFMMAWTMMKRTIPATLDPPGTANPSKWSSPEAPKKRKLTNCAKNTLKMFDVKKFSKSFWSGFGNGGLECNDVFSSQRPTRNLWVQIV